MKPAFALLACLTLIGCTGPISPRQRAEASTDVPEDHPHPPGYLVPIPGDPGPPLRCWNNGEDTVCKRDPQ